MLASTFVSNGWLWESVYGCKTFYGRAVLCTHCTTACSMTKCCKRYHVLWYLVHLNSTRNIDLGYILAYSISIIFKWLHIWCLYEDRKLTSGLHRNISFRMELFELKCFFPRQYYLLSGPYATSLKPDYLCLRNIDLPLKWILLLTIMLYHVSED